MAGTTKSNGQKHELDKFYTMPETAKWCIEKLNLEDYQLIIEPSAGSGSFSNQLPSHKTKAYDLEPEHPSIIQQDWLKYTPEDSHDTASTLIIGNPPFGQQNTLATKFINHSATIADTIAFILPKSFMKESVQKLLNQNLHLKESFELPRNSFTLNGEPINVPCVFQIWEKQTYKREQAPTPTPNGWKFVKKEEAPHLAVQRVGGRAGSVTSNWEEKNEHTHYFIKLEDENLTEELKTRLESLTHPSREWATGPLSISKRELLQELHAQPRNKEWNPTKQ